MAKQAILRPTPVKSAEGARRWLARAAQARRIALMLAAKDAAILESFAMECEARAAPRDDKPLIAA
ncbi:MAG TPA: hypothetical protein VFA53_05455 [Xanthobacteraceae bacterium]|nr:hypothetical protein [Xanthobacteraceae bacterium]